MDPTTNAPGWIGLALGIVSGLFSIYNSYNNRKLQKDKLDFEYQMAMLQLNTESLKTQLTKTSADLNNTIKDHEICKVETEKIKQKAIEADKERETLKQKATDSETDCNRLRARINELESQLCTHIQDSAIVLPDTKKG